MKSVVELTINLPQARLAALFADPRQNIEWMTDVERVETISGRLGMPGSKYRLIPKKGDMVFDVTVIARKLPNEIQLQLKATNVSVAVKADFIAVSSDRSLLRSEEVFTFEGRLKVFGLMAQGAIKKAHRRHMAAFKRFAETDR